MSFVDCRRELDQNDAAQVPLDLALDAEISARSASKTTEMPASSLAKTAEVLTETFEGIGVDGCGWLSGIHSWFVLDTFLKRRAYDFTPCPDRSVSTRRFNGPAPAHARQAENCQQAVHIQTSLSSQQPDFRPTMRYVDCKSLMKTNLG